MALWVGGEHPTDGLAGYPARDYGAPGGTPVYAWDTLRVERITGSSGSRGPGFGGFNLYLKDRAGRTYFVTHVENLRVRVGEVLKPTTQIANVGTYSGMATHVHIGYTGGDPVRTLGLRPDYLFSPGGAAAGQAVVADHLGKSSIPVLGQGKTQAAGFHIPIGWGKYGPEVGGIALGPGQVAQAWDVGSAGAGGVATGVRSIGDAFSWLGGNWDRVLEVAAGVVLIVIGLVLMGRSLGVTKTKVEVVQKALPGSITGRAPTESSEADLSSPPKTVYVVDDADPVARRSRARSRRTSYDPSTSEIPY